MILRWEQGRAAVDGLLARGQLTRVTANWELAGVLLGQASAHVASASAIAESDPSGAFALAYDAARKALTAILVNQGLRAGGDGAHAVLLDVHPGHRPDARLLTASPGLAGVAGWHDLWHEPGCSPKQLLDRDPPHPCPTSTA